MPTFRFEPVEGKYLKPGDLFSDRAPETIQRWKLPSIDVSICLATVPDDNTVYCRITIEPDPAPKAQKTQEMAFDPINNFHYLKPPGL